MMFWIVILCLIMADGYSKESPYWWAWLIPATVFGAIMLWKDE